VPRPYLDSAPIVVVFLDFVIVLVVVVVLGLGLPGAVKKSRATTRTIGDMTLPAAGHSMENQWCPPFPPGKS
jgi:hypothetical protein